MNEQEQKFLADLGIIVTDVSYEFAGSQDLVRDDLITTGAFVIDYSKFRSTCHLIKIVGMICESKNPAVAEMFDQLITMMELTKE
jgi:hypothetical protein